jgi:hypothetical protein
MNVGQIGAVNCQRRFKFLYVSEQLVKFLVYSKIDWNSSTLTPDGGKYSDYIRQFMIKEDTGKAQMGPA